MGPRASVVLPVRDGGATLPDLLTALADQDLAGGLEIVALDSASCDGSVDLLRRHGARVCAVPPGTFDHGLTRNLGAAQAAGTFVVFLSQDAIPQGRDFVARLLAPLEADATLAGAFARQVARPDADALTRRDLACGFAAGGATRVSRAGSALDALPPFDRYRLCAFDDVASAVPRELLLAHPFATARFGEDVAWGQRMLRAGFGLAYVADAVVVHSHLRRARDLYRRNYLGHRTLFRLFGLRTVPDARHLARLLPLAVAADLRTLWRDGAAAAQWLAAPVQAAAAVYGQYAGARDEQAGRPWPGWP